MELIILHLGKKATENQKIVQLIRNVVYGFSVLAGIIMRIRKKKCGGVPYESEVAEYHRYLRGI